MKKEDFTALGISEDLAEKAAVASAKELENYVSKTDLEEAKAAKASLEKDIKARDKQLEDLKKASGDNADLQKKITELQEENRTVKEKYAADMKELKLTAAVKLAVAASAQDVEIVSGLVDRAKLVLSEDGKVTGLEEQISALKKDKAFLFKPEDGDGSSSASGKPAYRPRGGKTNEGGLAKALAETMNKETQPSENPYAKSWG